VDLPEALPLTDAGAIRINGAIMDKDTLIKIILYIGGFFAFTFLFVMIGHWLGEEGLILLLGTIVFFIFYVHWSEHKEKQEEERKKRLMEMGWSEEDIMEHDLYGHSSGCYAGSLTDKQLTIIVVIIMIVLLVVTFTIVD
jgi:uncharacterized membrane protein